MVQPLSTTCRDVQPVHVTHWCIIFYLGSAFSLLILMCLGRISSWVQFTQSLALFQVRACLLLFHPTKMNLSTLLGNYQCLEVDWAYHILLTNLLIKSEHTRMRITQYTTPLTAVSQEKKSFFLFLTFFLCWDGEKIDIPLTLLKNGLQSQQSASFIYFLFKIEQPFSVSWLPGARLSRFPILIIPVFVVWTSQSAYCWPRFVVGSKLPIASTSYLETCVSFLY